MKKVLALVFALALLLPCLAAVPAVAEEKPLKFGYLVNDMSHE